MPKIKKDYVLVTEGNCTALIPYPIYKKLETKPKKIQHNFNQLTLPIDALYSL